MKYKLLTVTVTYKPNIQTLYDFIKSYTIYNDLGDDSRLVIVDNSPTGTWDTAKTKELFDIDIISNPANTGFGAGNNLGFEAHKSDYVLFVNNDTEFTEPVFSKLISKFESTPGLGCVGIHQDGGAPSFFNRSESPLPKKEIRNRLRNGQFDPFNFFLSGAFLMLPSDVFISIGKFDPKIFMYCEESDLLNRLNAAGYTTEYVPELSFLHKVGSRKKMDEYLVGTVLSQSYCYFLKKHGYENHKHLFFSRRINYYKRIVYFMLLFNFKEVAKIIRIIKTETRIYKTYFHESTIL